VWAHEHGIATVSCELVGCENEPSLSLSLSETLSAQGFRVLGLRAQALLFFLVFRSSFFFFSSMLVSLYFFGQ
jgi:hypothetical protein